MPCECVGRRRYIKDINSKNFNLRSFAERTAVNTPIQGTAADIIKIAMLQVQEQLKKRNFEAKMLLQVHDELIFKPQCAKLAHIMIPQLMPSLELDDHMSMLFHRGVRRQIKQLSCHTPLKIDVNVGFNWYDMERV